MKLNKKCSFDTYTFVKGINYCPIEIIKDIYTQQKKKRTT